MGRYIQATARKNFLCAWRCCACSHMNVEEPEASMSAREDITLFQKEAAAREKAGAQASKNLDALLDKIPVFVNEKQNYNQLEKCGTCSRCGTQQPWAKKTRHTLMLVILVLAVAIAAAIAFPAAIAFVIFGGLLASMGALALGDVLSVRARRRAALEMNDEHCRPLALTRAVPEYVSRDDPRLQAIFAHLAEKRSA